MQEPFIGGIVLFGGTFAPRGWAFCDGQLLSIADNTALFSILGTNFGGDGRTTFGLPDLRGRAAKHAGGSAGPGLRRVHLGEKGGREEHTLNVAEIPSHSHETKVKVADQVGAHHAAFKGVLGKAAINETLSNPVEVYVKTESATFNEGNTLGGVEGQANGGGLSFPIESPYQGINYIIALQGIFPARS